MPTDAHLRPDTSAGEMVRSLVGWLCLFAAAGLFAVVSLAPKIDAWLELRRAFETGRQELLALEAESCRLDRMIDALCHDEGTLAELARFDFDLAEPTEERIPLTSALSIDARSVAWPIRPSRQQSSGPWYAAPMEWLAEKPDLRRRLLVAAMLLLGLGLLAGFGLGCDREGR